MPELTSAEAGALTAPGQAPMGALNSSLRLETLTGRLLRRVSALLLNVLLFQTSNPLLENS